MAASFRAGNGTGVPGSEFQLVVRMNGACCRRFRVCFLPIPHSVSLFQCSWGNTRIIGFPDFGIALFELACAGVRTSLPARIPCMPKIKVLPHEEICPSGAELEAGLGMSVLDALLAHDIDVEHACEKSCACTTCHLIIREGFDSLMEATEDEEDLLDRAWGLEPESRLGCQAIIDADDLIVEIPRYTINHAKEEH